MLPERRRGAAGGGRGGGQRYGGTKEKTGETRKRSEGGRIMREVTDAERNEGTGAPRCSLLARPCS